MAEQSPSAEAGGFQNAWHLLVPGTEQSLPQIRQMVVDAAEHCGFSQKQVGEIEMAVGEACTNIIQHAYEPRPSRLELEIHIQEFSDRLEITILDYSPVNFPVDKVPVVDFPTWIKDPPPRGLGLPIIRNFVDRLEHRFIYGQGNELRMVKYFA